jgi:hypothetical protein
MPVASKGVRDLWRKRRQEILGYRDVDKLSWLQIAKKYKLRDKSNIRRCYLRAVSERDYPNLKGDRIPMKREPSLKAKREDALKKALAFIQDQYRDDRAAALEGSPFAAEARPIIEIICNALYPDSKAAVEGGECAAVVGGPLESQREWPAKGDRMRFLGENGYDHELKAALKVFDIGREYEVVDCDVQSWSHSISFVGISGRFNGVMFALSSEPTTPEGHRNKVVVWVNEKPLDMTQIVEDAAKIGVPIFVAHLRASTNFDPAYRILKLTPGEPDLLLSDETEIQLADGMQFYFIPHAAMGG